MEATEGDVVEGEFNCPRCGELLHENRPLTDRFLVVAKHQTVRFRCKCGYYVDEVVDPSKFKAAQ